MVRVSPASPSKWIATRSPLPASTWRSTQLYATLSSPPTNHFANGASSQSSVRSKSFAHVMRVRACSAQNPSWSSAAASYMAAVPLACAANAGSGAKSISCAWLDRLSSVTACSSSLSVRPPANRVAARTATARPPGCRWAGGACDERAAQPRREVVRPL